MDLEFVAVTRGLTREEIMEKVRGGWVYMGRQAVRLGGVVIDPTQPEGGVGVVDMDVWILPEPMVSVREVAQVLAEVVRQNGTLGDLVRMLLGMTLEELRALVEASDEDEMLN